MSFTISEKHRQPDERFSLPLFFSDHAVLQAKKPVRFWGKYPVDGGIAVALYQGQALVSTTFGAAKDGKFDLTLPEMPYGGPYTIRVIAENGGCAELQDILFGEVFLCGGQSNMQWEMGQCYGETMEVLRYQEDIDNSENPMIRCFRVDSRQKEAPSSELDGLELEQWISAAPDTTPRFSAAAYFFSRELYQTYKIPIGFVHCCEGGTRVQCWIPPEEFRQLGLTEEETGFLKFDGKDYSYSDSIWYNAKIHPLLPMTVRGALWYQGEGNPIGIQSPKGQVSHAYRGYADYLKLVIEGWRRAFEQPDMPFVVVQLPRYAASVETEWFLSREEDKRVCSLVDNAVYTVNIDTGLYAVSVAPGDPCNEGHGIHPYQKKEIGIRLAKRFMNAFLNEPILSTGPVLEEIISGDRAPILSYSNVGEGLCLTGELAGFELAGTNGVYHAATPELIDASHVKLSCPEVTDPVWVRYGHTNQSSLMTKPLTECGQSVCLYNTENGNAAFPAEQFWQKLI